MRKDAQINQQKIWCCATTLAARSIETVSMKDIATPLVSVRTPYRHYAHKSTLCLALVTDRVATFIKPIKSTWPRIGRCSSTFWSCYWGIFSEEHNGVINECRGRWTWSPSILSERTLSTIMWPINATGSWFKANAFETGMWVSSWYVNCHAEGD